MKKRITLADLSRATGFSQTTISMILAKRPGMAFSEETIQRVRKAARDLGYLPGRKGVTLFTRRAIMVVCPFIINHYYSAVVQTLQSAAADAQCNVLVYTTYNDPAEETKILRVLAESDIGGVVFAMMPQSRSLLRKIAKNVPIVIIADREADLPVDFIDLHNYQAGALMGRHLRELGHKNIVCVSTPLSLSLPARSLRYAGLRDAWTELCPDGRLSLRDSFINSAMIRDNIQLERLLGHEIGSSILESGDDFTAVVAINDMIAYGVLDAMAQANKKVPEDYSVCGLDNDFPSSLRGVSLTSVDHYMAMNAHLAFNLIQRKMSGCGDPPVIGGAKNIQPELIRRSSTGCPCLGKGDGDE